MHHAYMKKIHDMNEFSVKKSFPEFDLIHNICKIMQMIEFQNNATSYTNKIVCLSYENFRKRNSALQF